MIDFNTDIFGTAAPVSPEIMMGGKTETVEPMKLECPEPGVYYDVPAWEYHQWAAVSSTLLKGYATLPSTAKIPYEPADDAGVGSAIHAFTLQGQKALEEECFILPAECEGTSARAKALRAEYKELHRFKALVPHRYGTGPAESKRPIMEILKGVDTSFNTHLKTKEILANAKREVSLVWIDDLSGCLCKARIDALEDVFFWDIKKTQSIDKFTWQIKQLHYGVQLGHYLNGCIANGLPIVGAGFMPCEATGTYRVGCGLRESERLAADRTEAQRLVCLVKQSVMSGYWPNDRIPPHIWDLSQITSNDLVDIY